MRVLGTRVRAAFLALTLVWTCSLSVAAQKSPSDYANAANSKHESEPTSDELCIGCSVDGKTTPRLSNGRPNLNGFWNNPFPGLVINRADGSRGFLNGGNPKDPAAPSTPAAPKSEPAYKPEYAAKVKEILEKESAGYSSHGNPETGLTSPLDPLQQCKPLGVPRSMIPPLHIIQTPELMVVLYESDTIGGTFRMIYTDGRPHPKDIDPSYLGDSIGHWEGDTLVVDVIGLNDETWLGGGLQSEKFALMHSDQEHVIERYTRTGDILTYEATVDDPVVLTKPWVITPRHVQHGGPGDRLYESFCDNRDTGHYVLPGSENH